MSSALTKAARSTTELAVDGLTVAVHDTGGSGPAVVLVHGNSMSSRSFRHQLEGELGRTHRLVAIDLPGHGASSFAVDVSSTYSLPGYARVLVEVARGLGLAGAVFLGCSLGGHVVLEASGALPGAAGFAILGAPPLGLPPALEAAFKLVPRLAVAFREESDEGEVRAYQEALFQPGALVPDVFAEDFARTDKRARGALGASMRPAGYLDECAIVKGLAVPLAVLLGEQDQVVNEAYLKSLEVPRLWRGRIQVVPGAGHVAQWEAPAAFDRLVREFARDCARAS